ncbi:LytR/AlgR family response regulator transcription factor [Muriicola sp. Z0-33]|uniref:LytR/AlgR family response regulator transcription factor n=1 Tax=Muriicola sp. Z0-33 TaxID=2816957 RepID=UPI002238C007|nr:LytTR family DNA-binding domain-containing protein [Muriicola sp. Z0-33]MCW5514750.1 LytTR family transcriptional regulator [Muriicola sp. Z0-33]
MDSTHTFFHTTRYKWILSIANGTFLYLFLMVFLPFGVSNYDPFHEYTANFLLEIGIFMPVTIVLTLINEFGVKFFFRNQTSLSFVVGWTLWTLIFTGFIVFLTYNIMGDWHDWRLSSVPGFIIDLSAVLLFPMAGTYFYFRYKKLQENYDAVLTNLEATIDRTQMLHFAGEGVKDKISISVSDFIYARAQDNYIELFYLKNGTPSRFLIRSSLSRLYSTLGQDFLVRCHRSYMVNLYNVHSIKGGITDLRITMSHIDSEIPVSKTFATDTLDSLHKYKRFQ